MQKYIFTILFLFLASTISSCTTQVHVRSNIRTAKKSFVKIETYVAQCDKKTGTCMAPKLFASGSGSIVRYRSGKAILTAAHVCYLGSFEKEINDNGGAVLLKAKDRSGRKVVVRVIKYNTIHDICLLSAEDLDLPALRLTIKAPEYSEKVYNIAAPMGISNKEMVPIFEGLYMGVDNGRAYYSIPTIGGASGSPILNTKGELVGMIHSVHYRFHHLAVSVAYQNLWNFLRDNQDHIDIYVKQASTRYITWPDFVSEDLPLDMYFLKYIEDFKKQ